MKKFTIVCLVTFMFVAVGFGTALAEGHPAAKATAAVYDISVVDWDPASWEGADQGWTTILSNTLKTANKKDLFVDVSLEVGLYTDTEVKSKGGVKDTSVADSGVMVRVLVDPIFDGEVLQNEADALALPGEIVFGRRTQTLSAIFGGVLSGDDIICTTTCDDSIPPSCTTTCTINYATVDYEELQLILQTMNANSFNFIMDGVDSGVHKIVVQAKIDLDGSNQNGSYEAKALIGNGSVTIEEVRMIEGEEIVMD